MNVMDTALPGLRIIEATIYQDIRGSFMEIFQISRYRAFDLPDTFVQDNVSHSTQGVLRGLHYQLIRPQGKLVCVLSGTVLDVVVDLRQSSPTFGESFSIELSAENGRQLFIPEGCAHGFFVRSEQATFLYKCTDYYDSTGAYGIHWKDPSLQILWGDVTSPILSEQDQSFPYLKDVPRHLLPL